MLDSVRLDTVQEGQGPDSVCSYIQYMRRKTKWLCLFQQHLHTGPLDLQQELIQWIKMAKSKFQNINDVFIQTDCWIAVKINNWKRAKWALGGSVVNLTFVWLFLHTGAIAGELNSHIRAAGPRSSAAAPQTTQSASENLQRVLGEKRRHTSLRLSSPSAKLATPLETLGMSWSSSTLKTSAGGTSAEMWLGF